MDEILDLPAIAMLRHLQAGRNKNLNRGFRKLNVWREAVDLYAFEKKCLDRLKSISFKIKDQINPRAKTPRRKERMIMKL